MATHSSGSAIMLQCKECGHVHQRVWKDEGGFGKCNQCSGQLERRRNGFDRRVNTQQQYIVRDSNAEVN